MKTSVSKCHARAGLLGNPSDGYNGKTISFAIGDYFAQVELVESESLSFQSTSKQPGTYPSLQSFVSSPHSSQSDGADRLLKSALNRTLHHFPGSLENNTPLFSTSFASNIPRQVGMAGSSAIVIAALRAYADWFGIEIEPAYLASIALAAEHDLGIAAGLQDRVIQAFQGMMFMDFAATTASQLNGMPIGKYCPMATEQLQNVYVAFANSMPESTEVLHGDLKRKFESGDKKVVDTIHEIAHLATLGKQAIEAGDESGLAELIDRNFDLRQTICVLNPGHVQMIETARRCGASAKYCGSGGAIVGTFSDPEMLTKLKQEMQKIDCVAFQPTLV